MKRFAFTILCCLTLLSVSIIAVSASSSFLEQIVELADSYKGGSGGGGGRGGGSGGRGGSSGGRSGGGSRGGSSGGRSGSGGRGSGGRSSGGRSGGRASGGNRGGRTGGQSGKSGKSGRTAGSKSQSSKSQNKGIAGRMAGRTRTAGLKAAQARASLSKLANSITSKFSKVSPALAKAFPNMAKAFSAMKAAATVKGPRVNSLTARFNAAFAAQPAVTGKLTAAAIQASVQNKAIAAQPTATVSGYKIDKGLLTKNEAFSTKGYVPQSKTGAVVGKSGVTVGTGFDIGQQSVKGLKSLGLSPSLVDKLSPYTGLKQTAAKNFLSKNPLSLTAAEAKAIDKAVMDKSLSSLAKDYEAAAAKNPNAVKNFKDLPASVQSVAYSVQHQYGSIKKATPGFFGQLTKNDYTGMVNNLRNFGDAYSTRRNREADHLESGLKAAKG